MDEHRWQEVLSRNPDAYSLASPVMTDYIAHTPFPKQRAFMLLPHLEAFYGGAAAGGKSDCLLMCALQYVHVPGYNALIIRKTLKDADNPESILFRCRKWLLPWMEKGEVGWWPKQNLYLFPSGATLQFGYLDKLGDEHQYDSSEYQLIAFDELTHFFEGQYEYLFTRLRGPKCPIHKKDIQRGEEDGCQRCVEVGPLSKVPLRMRAASNPGGRGHSWVRDRFQIQAIPGRLGPTGKQLYMGTDPKRPHIPSFMVENEYVDYEGYAGSLAQMKDLVVRQQKEDGNWGVQEEGRFKLNWIKRYTTQWPLIQLGRPGSSVSRSWHIDDQCYQFLMVDSASSVKSTPGKTELESGKQGSYTSIARWLVTPLRDLCLMKAWRGQVEIPELTAAIRVMLDNEHLIQFVGLEYTSQSIHLYQMLENAGFAMKAFTTGGRDKVMRSGPAQNMMMSGKLWFPYQQREGHSKWLQCFEDEVFSWVGDPKQVDDQIDNMSYAAIHVTQNISSGVAEMASVM